MCSLTVGLMAASMGLQMYQNNMQSHAQRDAYKAQAAQAEMNKKLLSRKAETQAESYAQKQHQLNERYKLAVGNARAQFGGSGLDGGSLNDVLASSTDAYQRDSQNLLSNQRMDSWANYVEQTNEMNKMNAYNTMAANTKKQARINQFGTLLGGAASIYAQGYKENLWGPSKK